MMSIRLVPGGWTSARYAAGSPPGIAACSIITTWWRGETRSARACSSLQDLNQIVVVVGPQPPARLGLDVLPVLRDLGLRQKFGIVGKQHPVAARRHRRGALVADLDGL